MYKSFDLLKTFSFVRTGGSIEEKNAADILLSECNKLGAKAWLEEFLVDGYDMHEAKLSFSDSDINIECCGVGMSSSTLDEGVTGPFKYVTSLNDAIINNIEGCICLVHSKLVNYKLYKKLVEKKVSGLILCCGDIYLDNDMVDLDPYMYRERHYNEGKIPAVCIRMKDAEALLRRMPESATIVVKQDEKKNTSHNVVAEIEGEVYKNEVVVFTAHFDSVSYSKGAYDNATGSTTIMQMLAYFMENKPKRTLKFIWCGSEEIGLVGSRAYCEKHKDELSKVLFNINVDMTGVLLGYDTAVCSCDDSVAKYIEFLGKIEGFPISTKVDLYSSDSSSFAGSGVPAVTFARLEPRGGAQIHSRLDTLNPLDPQKFIDTVEFMVKFSDNIVNAKVFPVVRELPKELVEKLERFKKMMEAENKAKKVEENKTEENKTEENKKEDNKKA